MFKAFTDTQRCDLCASDLILHHFTRLGDLGNRAGDCFRLFVKDQQIKKKPGATK